MAAKPENTFIASVHKFLPPGRKDPYHMKNNNEYTSGIADCWYSGMLDDLWIEYKFIVLPKRGDTMILPDLSALQADWCRERHKEGRNVAVIVGCKEGGVLFQNLEWESEISAAAFKVRIQDRKELATWIIEQTQRSPIKRK